MSDNRNDVREAAMRAALTCGDSLAGLEDEMAKLNRAQLREVEEVGMSDERTTLVAVPKDSIGALEAARAELWRLADAWGLTDLQVAQMQHVTSVMWSVTHRRYEELSAGGSGDE